MSHEYEVLVYGTVCLDVLWRVAQLPPPGGYVDILEERREIGGEAANTAVALARWGVRVALVGNALGDDADGRLLRARFARDAPEIDLRFLKTSPTAQTPYCVCTSTPDGERTMFGYRFTEMQPPPLDPALASSARLFTMEPNAYAAGAAACRSRRLRDCSRCRWTTPRTRRSMRSPLRSSPPANTSGAISPPPSLRPSPPASATTTARPRS